MKSTQENNIFYTVVDTKRETESTVTLSLACKDMPIPVFCSGQFITIFFPETGHAEGKAYSISNAPHEKYLRLTVKLHGVFSGRLHTLQVGDTVLGSLPYGYFYSENKPKNIVMIAGGIGIAPVRSLIMDMYKNGGDANVTLFYSNKKADDIVFKNEFDELAKKRKHFTVQYYVTQEKVLAPLRNGRIAVGDIISSDQDKDTEYFICGSISFVRDYWKALKEAGTPEEKLYTESFF